MTGALYYWRRDIEADVRIVMRAEGLTELSIEARKRWAREFIQQSVPWWSPGTALHWAEQQMVGAAFEVLLSHAKRARDRLARQDRANATRTCRA